MASERSWRALASGFGLVALGVVAEATWRHGLWATLTGTLIVALWLGTLRWSAIVRPRTHPLSPEPDREADDSLPLRALLDQIPIPLLSLRGGVARTLNRAARALFATDDRVMPLPAALMDPAAAQLLHEGRRWRIDRVDATGASVVALIDVEAEGRAAEARATAEMIQVLGHELLNGLARSSRSPKAGSTRSPRPGRAKRYCPRFWARSRGGQRGCCDSPRRIARWRACPIRRARPFGWVCWPTISLICSPAGGARA